MFPHSKWQYISQNLVGHFELCCMTDEIILKIINSRWSFEQSWLGRLVVWLLQVKCWPSLCAILEGSNASILEKPEINHAHFYVCMPVSMWDLHYFVSWFIVRVRDYLVTLCVGRSVSASITWSVTECKRCSLLFSLLFFISHKLVIGQLLSSK